MSVIETKYAMAPTPKGQVYTVSHTATADRWKVPEDWKGNMVTFVSQTDDLFVRFGNAGVSVDASKVAVQNTTTEDLAPHAASGFIVLAGAYVSVSVDSSDTYFAVDSSAATGVWCCYRSSGANRVLGEALPTGDGYIGAEPVFWADFSAYDTLTLSSSDIQGVRSLAKNKWAFTETSNPPSLVAASAAVGNRDAASFASGSSESLICSNAELAALLSSASAFTVCIVTERGATAAAHTLFSAGTTGTDNGRFDITLDASDDVVVTRVDSAGSSTALTHTATVSSAVHVVTYVFDGSAGYIYLDPAGGTTAASTSGSNSGDVGTLTTVALGARRYNTSTEDQYLEGEMHEVLVFDRALTGAALQSLHRWVLRRYGK